MTRTVEEIKEKTAVKTTIFLIFSGSAMIAHGLRMMTQGLFYPNSIYPAPVVSSIDFWLDWFTLSILGVVIIIIGGKRWIRWVRTQKKKESKKEKVWITPT